MKSQSEEKKYMPRISQREIAELRNTIVATSQKIIAENIEKMKKTDPNRPEGMQYFDDIASFVTREKEILTAKEKGKKVKFLVGGIIPSDEVPRLEEMGVSAVFGPDTPTDEVIKCITS